MKERMGRRGREVEIRSPLSREIVLTFLRFFSLAFLPSSFSYSSSAKVDTEGGKEMCVRGKQTKIYRNIRRRSEKKQKIEKLQGLKRNKGLKQKRKILDRRERKKRRDEERRNK